MCVSLAGLGLSIPPLVLIPNSHNIEYVGKAVGVGKSSLLPIMKLHKEAGCVDTFVKERCKRKNHKHHKPEEDQWRH